MGSVSTMTGSVGPSLDSVCTTPASDMTRSDVDSHRLLVFLSLILSSSTPEAKAAPEICFKDVNSKGDRFGNCGYQNYAYKKCESR